MNTTKQDLLKLINENYFIKEDHLESKENKIDYILQNQYLTDLPFLSVENLESMSDEDINSLYNKVEDEKDLGSGVGDDYEREIDFDELEIEEPVDENELSLGPEEYDKEQQAHEVAMEDIDGWSDKEVAEYLGVFPNEINWDYRQDAIEKREDYYLELWKEEGLSEERKKKKPSAGLTKKEPKILTKKEIMEQFNKKQNIKETTEVAKKHPSVINQERINKETAKSTAADRKETFVKNMDKIVKGNDDFKTVEEPKFDKDSLKKEDILDKNAGMSAEENLEEYRIGGIGELRYDSKPKGFDERQEKEIDPVKGKRVYANSVATDLGAQINKFNKKKIENKNKAPLYNKEAQPTKNVKEEDKGKKLSNVSEQKKTFVKKENKQQEPKGTPIRELLSEESLKELEKMRHLFNYKPNDFINNKKNIIKNEKTI